MPDSPSIPATGWDGLPKRKARPLIVQVTKDRFRSAESATWEHHLPLSRYRRHRILALAGLLLAVAAVLCLFSLSVHRADHVQNGPTSSPGIWDSLLFQEEELDGDGDVNVAEDIEALIDGTGKNILKTGQRAEASLPFSCSADRKNATVAAKYGETTNLLTRSVLYAGTGNDLTRAMHRAANLSRLWSEEALMSRSESETPAFRVMVIGGSVSNCRGVDRSLCWHSHLMRWLSNTFPLGSPKDKTQMSHRFIDLAKSATGSTFFSYCWRSELALRKKDSPFFWGEGPDLIVIESGINDVVSPRDFVGWENAQSYERDFESLLFQLKDLPSQPAIIVLDAASKLLDRTEGFRQAAEFTMHLAPSVWMDVPLISAKAALMTPDGQHESAGLGEIFLADGHHPNVKGHELLANLLIAHLEDIICRSSGPPQTRSPDVNAPVSLYSSLASVKPVRRHPGQCIQFGAAGEKHKPRKNRGWNRLAASRDKQYMASSSYGSRMVYDVNVTEGGEVLLSWLKSRFYNLGEAKVTLDDQKPGVKINGHWQMGWSIGVPTAIFENVTAGIHSVTIEHVRPKGKTASETSSNFRLIALAAT